MTDAELVDRARQGDQRAFGDLVDRHQTAAIRTALVALGSREDAEDVTQDAFVAAYRKLATYRGHAAFRTWLLTIVWNLGRNRRKSLTRRLRVLFSTETNHGTQRLMTSETSPEQTVVNARLLDDALRMIRSLPTPLRDALLMSAMGSQPYEDVAAVLGVPVGTLKWRVAEARRRVREKLRRRGWSDD